MSSAVEPPPFTSSGPTYRVGIVGASGYTGAEMMRLLAGHPNFELEVMTGDSKAGTPIADLYPSLALAYRGRRFEAFIPEIVDGLDVVFCGLPHGVSMGVIPEIIDSVGVVVDLGSDFRLKDPLLYPNWYGAEHSAPEYLPEAAYGLPELFRSDIAEARLIAATGCNAATATLTLAPLLAARLIAPDGIVINLITGVSGAGRPPKENTTFCTVDENVTAYGLLTHRHTPEIEQALSVSTGHDVSVLFTPHLAPLNRGILASCYGRPTNRPGTPPDTREVLEAMADYYRDEPFVVVDERSPSTKAVTGSNAVHLTGRVDPRTGLVLGIGVLDNLMKGASGMAVQCANIAVGLPETTGLATVGVYP
ncbi:MAG: N-acetyl-gamma-glutamyl-phosphate reductase [Acidimicrobiia bacterium]|nr:N-acetyl-gamma-glutamyl-phosphate reductase [Acidimicrobiia bacterium]MDH5519237.1 N-acetyl-gamma-glutamyl-phosphate reductase [Acidimicrobiia bacterium]